MKQSRMARTSGAQSTELLGNPFFIYLVPPAFLGLITALFYAPSLNYPFQFDDLANITKNFNIRFINWRATFLSGSRWMGDIFNSLSFQLGRFDPFYYRILNLGIHLAAGIVLFYFVHFLCAQTTRRPFLKEYALSIASLTAGLFLLHPVQTQTVSYVIQARLEGLASLFVISGLFIYAAALRSSNLLTKGLLIAGFFGVGFLACGTKELVVAMPFLALLIDWFFIAQESWDAFKYRLAIYVAFTAFIIVTLFQFLEWELLRKVFTLQFSTTNNRGNIITPGAFDLIKPIPFFISQFKVVLHYLFMFILPVGLCVEYDWVLSKSFFAADAFLPFCVLAGLIGLAFYAMYCKKHTYYSFGLFWFLISVAPRSTVIPSPELMCDYKTYLASAGWLFMIAVASIKFFVYCAESLPMYCAHLRLKHVQLAALSCICIGLGYASMERNHVWESPYNFWKDIVTKAPGKARGHNNLGVAYAERGEIDKAIASYLQAIRLDSNYVDPYNNLAVGYSAKEEYSKAIGALNQAIVMFPYYAEAHNNRGSLLIRTKNYPAAERDLLYAIQLRPHYGKAYYNLGRLYYELGDKEKAWTHFKKATEADLDDAPQGFQTLGQLSMQMKKYDEGIDAFERMLGAISRTKNLPNREQLVTSTLFSLANSYFMKKHYDKAEQIYKELAHRYPLNPEYMHNLGEVRFTQGRYNEAFQIFNRARNNPKSLPQTHIRMVNCFEKLGKLDKAIEYVDALLTVQAPENFKQGLTHERARLQAEVSRQTLQRKVDQGEITLKDIGSELQALNHATH